MAKTRSFMEMVTEGRDAFGFTAPHSKADTSFAAMIKELLNADDAKPGRPLTLRPSRLPICQWAAMLSALLGTNHPPEIFGFKRDFYTRIGHTVHSVVQEWLGRIGYLFGPYKCKKCGHKQIMQGWQECPNGCRMDWEYLEIDLGPYDKTKEFGSAHADGLIRFPWMPEGTYYLIDIKTCSLKTLPDPAAGFTSKYQDKYLLQTAIYTNLFTRYPDVVIEGTVFLMFPRDDPKAAKAIIYDQSETHGPIFHKAVKSWRDAKKAAVHGDASCVNRECESKSDRPDCPLNGLCFDRRTTEMLFEQKLGKLPILPDF